MNASPGSCWLLVAASTDCLSPAMAPVRLTGRLTAMALGNQGGNSWGARFSQDQRRKRIQCSRQRPPSARHRTVGQADQQRPDSQAESVDPQKQRLCLLPTAKSSRRHLISAPTPTPQHRPVGQTDKDLARPAPAELAEPGPKRSSARLSGSQVAIALGSQGGN